MVQDRVFLGLLFVVGGSSLIWGLYEIFYVAPTSPSGLFNTVLGLLVLLVTWAFLLPYAVPARPRPRAPAERSIPRATGPRPESARPARPPVPTAVPAPPRRPEPAAVPRRTAPAVVAAPRPEPAGPAAAPALRPTPIPAAPRPPYVSPLRPVAAPTPDPELEALLAEFPTPTDESLTGASPEEVVKRLDALLDDLSASDPDDPLPAPRDPRGGRGAPTLG